MTDEINTADAEKPKDCTNAPECCPQNEGYGCDCAGAQINTDAPESHAGIENKVVLAAIRNVKLSDESGYVCGDCGEKLQIGYVCDACESFSAVTPEEWAEEIKMQATRYRYLRDQMQFGLTNGKTVMQLQGKFPAPSHNLHTDWNQDRFRQSVDQTLDAEMMQRVAQS